MDPSKLTLESQPHIDTSTARVRYELHAFRTAFFIHNFKHKQVHNLGTPYTAYLPTKSFVRARGSPLILIVSSFKDGHIWTWAHYVSC